MTINTAKSNYRWPISV